VHAGLGEQPVQVAAGDTPALAEDAIGQPSATRPWMRRIVPVESMSSGPRLT
jgi:hypothetical protein